MVSKGVFNVRGEGISRFIGIASSAPVFDPVKHGCNSHQQSGQKAPTVAPAWIQHLKPWRSLGRGIRRPKSKVWGPTWISPAPRLTVIHIQSSSRLHCGHDQCPYMFPYIISLICSAMWVLFLGAWGGALVCFFLFEDVKVGCHVPYGWTQAPISPDCMSNWDVSSFWSLTCIPVRKWL